MLEKPNISDEVIVTTLKQAYGLSVKSVTFLPWGADLNTAVYHATTQQDKPFFVKLRRGPFLEASVMVPHFLDRLGIRYVIPPVTTNAGRLWVKMAPFSLILYPFVAGRHAYEGARLTPNQWQTFGAALKMFHTAVYPPSVTKGIPQETFSPRWRNKVRQHLAQLDRDDLPDAVARETAVFLQAKREATLKLVQRADVLARHLQAASDNFILCHGDIHGWNLLIDRSGNLHMIDWDTLVFAPKERDLMFIGGGLGNSGHAPQEECVLFYPGYGQTNVDPFAIAYYRMERIIEDIAIYCDLLFLLHEGGQDRQQSFDYLKSNYLPKGTIAAAFDSDPAS